MKFLLKKLTPGPILALEPDDIFRTFRKYSYGVDPQKSIK